MSSFDVARDSAAVLSRLDRIQRRERLAGARFGGLLAELDLDLDAIEGALSGLSLGSDPAARSAAHLLGLPGKRVRPLCLILAARLGAPPLPAARELAAAVELVHVATLLHDDVVDLGTTRRGAEVARLVYGNAASIFGGDLLLLDALRRVFALVSPARFGALIDAVMGMVAAEARQLELAGRLSADRADYLAIAIGKTAGLFEWALVAGGELGGLAPPALGALGRFGRSVGVAFQIADDCLDFDGDPAETGKALHADLAEGKPALPLVLAVERAPALAKGASPGALLAAVHETGALAAATAIADRHLAEGLAELRALPSCPARDVLELVAHGLVHRRR